MKLVAKIAVGGLALIGIFYISAVTLLTWSNPCIAYPIVELPSPGGQYSAAVDLEYCEADASSEMDLWVSSADNRRRTYGVTLATNPATTEIYLEWRSPDTLVVRHPPVIEPENRPESLGNVRVRFEQSD